MEDIEWLPDGSGFLFSMWYMSGWDPVYTCAGQDYHSCSNIFEYNLATQQITQRTDIDDKSVKRVSRLARRPVYRLRADDGPGLRSDEQPVDRETGRFGAAHAHRRCGTARLGSNSTDPSAHDYESQPSQRHRRRPCVPLTVNGTNFVGGSVVRWNGNARATTYVNDTRLTASIPAADIATAGSASVTVFNPAPGGGTSNAATFAINNNPAPTITSLNPASAIAGGPAFSLTVNGAGFVSGSVVRWNGSARPTTYVNGTRLTASISAADIATAGSASVTVFNPAPGGGTSNAATFAINHPAPTITSLNPASAIAGGPAFSLTVNGAGFVSGSVVRWNGSARATTYVNGTRLTASISAADIATAGSASVTVFNPAPGGGTSNAATFAINHPAPTITSLNPASAIAGGSAFSLTVNGAGFVSGSVVRWNGSARPTTYVNGTRLTASIPAADIATAGSASVTVFNPAPGGGTSSAATFAINHPAPTITSLNPASAMAGGSAFSLTVNGAGFVSGSVVRWNGSDRATTHVNNTRLTASISAADIATAGSANVTVFNPAPGGGTSNAVAFGVANHRYTYLPAILR